MQKIEVNCSLEPNTCEYCTMQVKRHYQAAPSLSQSLRTADRSVAICRVISSCRGIGRSSKADMRVPSRIPLANGRATRSLRTVLIRLHQKNNVRVMLN